MFKMKIPVALSIIIPSVSLWLSTFNGDDIFELLGGGIPIKNDTFILAPNSIE